MIKYVSEFRVVGEVADFLLLKTPDNKLLVDISPDAQGHEVTSFRKYPNRTTLTILDSGIINSLLPEIEIGDVIAALGSFKQSNYIPHRTTYIDTTFLVTEFNILKKSSTDHRPGTANAAKLHIVAHRPIN